MVVSPQEGHSAAAAVVSQQTPAFFSVMQFCSGYCFLSRCIILHNRGGHLSVFIPVEVHEILQRLDLGQYLEGTQNSHVFSIFISRVPDKRSTRNGRRHGA